MRPPVLDPIADERTHARRWWTLGVLCLSLLIIMVANTSLNVALPTLSETLGASASQLQWMVDAYSLAFAGLLFIAGNVGDRYGRKGLLQIGLGLFGLATLYAAVVASSSTELIIARIVMGAAAAMVMPATLSIITNIFPREERAKAVAAWAGISGAGTSLGPLLSGWMLEHSSWHAVFLVNVPFIVAALVAGYFFVPRLRSDHHAPLDYVGGLLSAAGVTTVVYTLINAPSAGWLSPSTLLLGLAGLGLVALFVRWELHTDDPMLDVRLFKIPAFGVSSLALVLVFFALMGMFFSMSMLLQLVYGYGPLEAAVRLLPITVAIMVAAPLSARLAARFGARRVVASGMLVVAAGVAVLTQLGVAPDYPVLVVGLVVMAFGMGIAMSPTTNLLMSAVPRSHAGMGSAMNDTTRELGGSLGVAVFGSLLASHYTSALAPVLAGLPAAAADAASSSLAGALGVGAQAGPAGQTLVAAAKDAWVGGFRFSLVVGAVIIAAASLIAYRFLPDRAADDVALDASVAADDTAPAGGLVLAEAV
jgi:EmrB/QacA subfamily drug resistance transporter